MGGLTYGHFSFARRPASAVARLAYRATQRLIVLDVTRVLWLEPATVQTLPLDPNYSFRFLSADETYQFSRQAENQIEPSFASRILLGQDLCYAALAGGSLAAYIWLARGSIEGDHNRGAHPRSGVGISFPDHVAFVYKAYTRIEHRGRRLFSMCLAQALEDLSPLGVKHLLSTTDWTNRAALAGFHRVGFRELGLLWRFGLMTRLFTISPRSARKLDIHFGPHAVIQPRRIAPAHDESAPAVFKGSVR